MRKYVDGYLKFRNEVYPEMAPLFKRLKGEQHPEALFITCSDSRVVPALITQSDPGDLFLIRNAGNIVPPYGEVHGGVSATIEYAVVALKVPHIVICGHSDCGAVKGMLHPEKLTDMPVVAKWLGFAEVARRVVVDQHQGANETQLVKALTYQNVVAQLDHLKTHPSVAMALARGSLRLHGWVYDIEKGAIQAYDMSRNAFVDLGEQPGEMPHATPRQRRLKLAEAV
jgi:carbonic anhydrase